MIDLVKQDGLTIAKLGTFSLAELEGASIAISGASGLIGRHLVAVLLGLADVHGINLTVSAIGRSFEKLQAVFAAWRLDPRLILVQGDVTQSGVWPDQVTHLIHAASPATPKAFAEDPVGVIRVNTEGSLRAVDHAIANQAYYCFISTMEVYGSVPSEDDSADLEIDENTLGLLNPIEVRSAYPESKRLGENLVMAAGLEYGLRGDIARLSHTYGPGTASDDNRVQVEFMAQAVTGRTIILKSDGTLSRHYTYAADAASAIVQILTTQHTRESPQVFNVADNASRVSIRQLAQLTLQAAGRTPDELVIDVTVPTGQLWSKMRGATFLNTSKIEALGWKPQFNLEIGLARMAQYLRQP